MQILHLQPELNLSCGITRVIHQLMRNSSANSTHYVMTFGGNAIYKFKKDRLSVSILPKRAKYIFSLFHIYKIIEFCKKHNITIIHAHHRYFDVLGYFAGKILGIATVTSVHSKLNSRKIFSYKADKLIAVSQSIKKHLQSALHINGNRITLIHNFIDETNYDTSLVDFEGLKNRLGIYKERTVIMFAGRFDKEKGIDILIAAFRKLQYEYIDLYLILIGDGKLKKSILEQEQTTLKDVKIIESQEDIAPYLQLADIIVLPSRVDPFPLIMLECGLLKKAFLGTKVDGIAEFIKDGEDGILVAPDDITALVKGFQKLLDNAALRAAIAGKLHKKVMYGYLKQHILQQYFSLYSTLKK